MNWTPTRVVVALLAALPLEAAAATRRVPEDYPTIQAALTAATGGDLVVVGPGIWLERLDFQGKAITLTSVAGAAGTTIQAPGGTAVLIGPGGAIDGFTISGGTASFGAGMAVTGSGTRITRNVFQNNIQDAGGYGAAIGGNVASPIIDGNTFRFNSCDSQFLSGVVSFINTSSPYIVNNVFADNSCRALNMTLPESAAPVVMNNTIVRNPVGIYVYRGVNTATQAFRNNLIAGNQVGVDVVFGTEADNPTWEHNLTFGNTTNYRGIDDPSGRNGNLTADPLLRDAAANDFRLGSGSPAIDAGAATGAPQTDATGRARPQDGDGDGLLRFDIGAFEFAAEDLVSAVLLSPPSGVYFRTQRADLVIAIAGTSPVVGGAVLLDGLDVTGAFLACAVLGRTATVGQTFRCPGAPLGILPAGEHTLSVRVDRADGTVDRRSVSWTVRSSSEP